jgi:hypothetical protein
MKKPPISLGLTFTKPNKPTNARRDSMGSIFTDASDLGGAIKREQKAKEEAKKKAEESKQEELEKERRHRESEERDGMIKGL